MKNNIFSPDATTKRLLAGFMVCLAMLVNLTPLKAETPQTAAVTWHVTSEQLNVLREELKLKPSQIIADPKSVADDRGLPLVYIVTAAVLLPDLARALVDVYKDIRYGKLIISQDAAGKITIQHDPKSSNAELVFIDANGGHEIVERNTSTLDATSLLEKLTKAKARH